MATRDVDLTGDPAVADFVRRVSQLSGGALRIEVAPFWGNGKVQAEQQIVRDTVAGKVDLGAVGTRVFDTLGVASFQALTAPMLIDSYALEQAVIASPIPEQMLEGLGKLELTGLAVLGYGLRKPIAVERPLLDPSEWSGRTFAVFPSRGEAAAIRALGARPVDLWGGALTDALGTGTVQAAENDLITYFGSGRWQQAPYVTANVNLWPRSEALVVNSRRFSQLTERQQEWLKQAAAAAAIRSTGLTDHDQRLTIELCKAGARFGNATAGQLAALRNAFAPVYTALRQDSQTQTFITQIEQLKQSTAGAAPLAIPAGCTGTAPGAPGLPPPAGDQSVVNGTYRSSISDADLKKDGVTGSFNLSQNHGIFTWVLRDGHWHVHQRASNPLPGSSSGDFGGLYTVTGTQITFAPPTGPGAPQGGSSITVRWKRVGVLLHFTVIGPTTAIDPSVLAYFTAHPWKKIG